MSDKNKKNWFQKNWKEVVAWRVPIFIALFIGVGSLVFDDDVEWQKRTLKLIDNVEAIVIIGGIVKWLQESNERRKQKRYQAWQVLGVVKQIGPYAQKKCLQDINEDGVSLADLEMSSAILEFINLSNADLRRADLSKANLQYAILKSADLSGADLNGADLNGADLSGADLTHTNLSGVNLRNANLQNASLNKAKLRGTTMPDGKIFSSLEEDFSEF